MEGGEGALALETGAEMIDYLVRRRVQMDQDELVWSVVAARFSQTDEYDAQGFVPSPASRPDATCPAAPFPLVSAPARSWRSWTRAWRRWRLARSDLHTSRKSPTPRRRSANASTRPPSCAMRARKAWPSSARPAFTPATRLTPRESSRKRSRE